MNTDKPVSRQFEDSYYGYYGYPPYWGGSYMWGDNSSVTRNQQQLGAYRQEGKTWDPRWNDGGWG